MKRSISILCLLFVFLCVSCSNIAVTTSTVGGGWAGNSVNTVIFRNNALYSRGNEQFIAFYDQEGYMVLGKRTLPKGKWDLLRSPYKGNISDAHNSISIISDDEGYLHVSWDHHNSRLRYAVSVVPGSLKLGEELAMTGENEMFVTYPEFYRMASGELIFLYRNGESGNGRLVMNRFDHRARKWTQLHNNLIDGQGKRNAYWQAFADPDGTLHVSWNWRETYDVATNHDLAYACSKDGGQSWQNSEGTPYKLPITAETAEYAARIPQGSELINQTSMATWKDNLPVIATYWKPKNGKAPQYHLVFKRDNGWETVNTNFRSLDFSLSGGGTKFIPIARPNVVVGNADEVFLIFRDAERSNRVAVAKSKLPDCLNWEIIELTTDEYAAWEPNIDPVRWEQDQSLHLFLQNVTQKDAEQVSDVPPSRVSILEYTPGKSR